MRLDELQHALGPDYILERELGGGGMSTVFLARDAALARQVVLKVLPAGLVETGMSTERFAREIRLAASLQQANIVPVFAAGVAAGQPYYVMPYVEGQSLRARLQEGPSLPLSDAIAILRDVARALAYAHRHGVVHRDIKPDNILLSGDAAVVTDFGIAKALQASTQAPDDTVTRTGTVIGTPAYMAPEQALGDPQMDHRVDLYAWGLLAYELASGKHPFHARMSGGQIMTAQITELPVALQKACPNVPRPLADLVMRCLEKDPAARPASATELLERFNATVDARGSSAPRRMRRSMLAAAGALLLVVGGAAALWRARQQSAVDAVEVTPADGVTHLAVLPFENQGAPEDEYFADGITDEVRSKLTSLPGLEVVARGSSTPYKRSTKSMSVIARELGVDYLLTGTVRWEKGARAGTGQVKVTPELVAVHAGSAPASRWQESMQREIAGIFTMQSDIATRVAEKLDVALGAREQSGLAARLTTNTEAYDAYLRGEEASEGMSGFGVGGLTRASRFYERATTLDPDFARAWARLALARVSLHVAHSYDSSLAVGSRLAAERAVVLAPDAATSHAALANYYSRVAWDNARALSEVAIALRLAPNDADMLTRISQSEAQAGQWEQATAHLERALTLDPRSSAAIRRLGQVYIWQRRYRQANALLDRGIALDPNNLSILDMRLLSALGTGSLDTARHVIRDGVRATSADYALEFFAGWYHLSWALNPTDQASVLSEPDTGRYPHLPLMLARLQLYHLRGNTALMRAYADSVRLVLEPQVVAAPNEANLRSTLGEALAGLGQHDAAIAEGRRGVALGPISVDGVNGPFQHQMLALIYMMVGEREQAIDELERILGTKYFMSRSTLRIDPTFAPLRGNPRFDRLVAGS